MRTSPLTMLQGDHCTVFTQSRIIRELQGHYPCVHILVLYNSECSVVSL